MDDAGARRHDLEVVERASGPSAGTRSARGCARTRARRCARTRSASANSSTCTEWSITSSAGISGLICAGSPPRSRHRVAHRGEVDDRRDAGEVLQQHARRARTRSRATARPSRSQPATASTSGRRRRAGARSRAGSAACTAAARRRTAPGARRAGRSRACDRRPRAWSGRRTRRWPCLDSIREACGFARQRRRWSGTVVLGPMLPARSTAARETAVRRSRGSGSRSASSP